LSFLFKQKLFLKVLIHNFDAPYYLEVKVEEETPKDDSIQTSPSNVKRPTKKTGSGKRLSLKSSPADKLSSPRSRVSFNAEKENNAENEVNDDIARFRSPRTRMSSLLRYSSILNNNIMSLNLTPSDFTIAKAQSTMKGELILKRTPYFCVLGSFKIFFCISEIDESPKGEYSVFFSSFINTKNFFSY
jgi:hypothetical protein